jgi:hypothetical protein
MGDTWHLLRDMMAWQVDEIPRKAQPRQQPTRADEYADPASAQRMQALASAFHRGTPLALAWVREHSAGPVDVLAAGQGLRGDDDQGQAVLTLPAGGRGHPLPPGGAADMLARLPAWVRLAGVADSLFAGDHDGRRSSREAPPSLEDGLLTTWQGPFAWLVLAEPVGFDQIDELTDAVNLAQLAAQRADSPRAQMSARRLEARHAEFRQAPATGLWQVHLLAGGENPHAAMQIAGLVCASADLDGLSYALAPRPGCASLDKILDEPSLTDTADRTMPSSRHDSGPPLKAADRDTGASLPARQNTAGWWEWDNPPPQTRSSSAGRRGHEMGVETLTSPFYGSSKLLAALARPPAREVPGVRFVLRPDFDVTPETGHRSVPAHEALMEDPGGVVLGTVLDWNRMPAGSLALPRSSLNRHTFVCGATGAGKSQTVRALLEAATGAGIPWLVVEPAKAEYKLMAARLPGAELIRIRPGEVDQPPAGVNPLEPAPGPGGARFPLQTHADLVRALFLAAFEADEPFPQVLAAALTRCYEQAGWDMATGEPVAPGGQPGYPTLADLQATAMTVVEEIGYGREITDNVRGFVKVRISSLRLGTTGRFLDGGHPLDFASLLERNVVLEIEDAGDDRDKAFLMGTVLIRLTEHLRMRQRHEGPTAPALRHLSVFEEAHRLLRQPDRPDHGAAAHAVEMFAGLLAEIRAYGEGLIIAEQIPSKLIPDVIKNTAVKIVHRLPAADDRDSVGATMNLTDDQSQYLVTLTPGEAAVFADGMDYPLLVRMPDGTARETTLAARTVSPSALIIPRSPSCGPHCHTSPCTLRQIRAAQRAAGADPRITLWAELSVLAHLTGWTMPMPAPEFAAALRAMDPRLRDCALAHAADAASASRGPLIAARVSLPQLAVHVTAAMRAAMDEQRWLCEQQEPQWLAPCYRWAVVLDSLKQYHRENQNAGRHPRSGDWEATYRQPIPGDTCARQFGAIQRYYDAGQRDHVQVSAVAYGTRSPTAIEHAVGASATDDDWEQRLADVMTAFRDCRWPRDYLRPTATAASAT